MYSARTINIQEAHAVNPAALFVSENLPSTESTLPGLSGILSARDSDFDVQGRLAWLFISIKNRGFTRPYINRFIDMCEAAGIEGRICPVDDPYQYNSMAELKLDVLPQDEIDKIARVSADIARMAQKAINGKLSKRVSLHQWRDIETATPSLYRAELTRAFQDGTKVRQHLYDHVTSVKPTQTERDFERFAEFFLCEVPVLFHAYYAHGASLDVYPGRQPDFFWQVELGTFAEELPELTALTRQGRPMLYLNTHDRSKCKPGAKT